MTYPAEWVNIRFLMLMTLLQFIFPSVRGQNDNHFGINVGVNFPSIKNMYNERYDTYHTEVFTPGYYVGLFRQINIENNKLFFKPGVEFSCKFFKDTSEYFYYEPYKYYPIYRYVNASVSFYYLEFPLMINYSIRQKLKFEIGVSPNIFLSGRARVTMVDSYNNFSTLPPPDSNLPISGINQFGFDFKTSISYTIIKKCAFVFSFQTGLTNIYKDKDSNLFEPNYATDYKGGRFYTYSFGVNYLL